MTLLKHIDLLDKEIEDNKKLVRALLALDRVELADEAIACLEASIQFRDRLLFKMFAGGL